MHPKRPSAAPSATKAKRIVSRRTILAAGAATLGALSMPGVLRAQDKLTIRVGYWPVSAGLPFFAAVEEGFFKEAGLTVEAQRYAGAQQVMEAMLSGRCDGSATGTGSAFLAIGQIAQPGLLKFICTNPSNTKYVLEEFLVPAESPVKTLADLSGKNIGSAPGIQNVTLARTVLDKAGAKGFRLVELPFGQHIPAIAAGQVDAVYTLEPQGTIGRLNGTTRILEAGVIAKYILGEPLAPWHGGAASLTSAFIDKNPAITATYVKAFGRGVELVRTKPDAARKYFEGYTAIKGDLAKEVPLSGYMMHNEFDDKALAYFQTFFDLFSKNGIFASPVPVGPMLYKG
jgi:NitT/TauT family transport system substrate-binding protein